MTFGNICSVKAQSMDKIVVSRIFNTLGVYAEIKNIQNVIPFFTGNFLKASIETIVKLGM